MTVTSRVIALNEIALPKLLGEWSMIPFDLSTLEGLPEQFKTVAESLLRGVTQRVGIGHFTFHGQQLKVGQSHRRGGPHTDGNYDRTVLDWNGGGGNGWKVGENGPTIESPEHQRLYVAPTGGIVMASNYSACVGWVGDFDGIPGVGGDCSMLDLGTPNIRLAPNTVYYGNNHFIHESLIMDTDVIRVLARVTLPATHVFQH